MCQICEKYNLGDVIEPVTYHGSCFGCGVKFDKELTATIWTRNFIDPDGYLEHLLQDSVNRVCPECGRIANGGYGVLCEGIPAGELFEVKEYEETPKTDKSQ